MDLDELTITTTTGVTRSDLVSAAVAAQIRHTIIGASTVTVIIPDDEARILTSAPSIAAPSTVDVENRTHRLVAVHHTARVVMIVYEDALIAALRAQHAPVMFATAMTAGDIITRFATEAGVPTDLDPYLAQLYVEGAGRSQLDTTDSWQEIAALAARLGGRAYSNGVSLVVATDAALLDRPPRATIAGHTDPLKSTIDFSMDVAQPQERAVFTVDTTAWTADAGDVVNVTAAGPADGPWLVAEWSRTLPLAGISRVRLTRPLTIGD